MHHGMLGTTGVLIHWAPGIDELAIHWAKFILWRQVAIPVPR